MIKYSCFYSDLVWRKMPIIVFCNYNFVFDKKDVLLYLKDYYSSPWGSSGHFSLIRTGLITNKIKVNHIAYNVLHHFSIIICYDDSYQPDRKINTRIGF